MRKKLIAFLTALTACINMSAVLAFADTEEETSLSETAVSTETEEEDKTEKSGTEGKQNPNISDEYADTKAVPLFNDSVVHTINLLVKDEDWNNMIETAEEKNYITCDAEIDGELIQNIAIRTKGNASLRAVSRLENENNTHYSFKIEFDHNDNATTYHGLDKLALNNLGQDITCQKDYLVYHMMNDMGVKAPMTSYTVIQKNGEDFGLYLAVEAIEDAFAVRNYGSEDVDLYKPEIVDKIEFSKVSNLRNLFMIMSGKQYADKTPDDRVDVFADYWSGVYDYYAVPYMQWTGNEEDYSLFFDKDVFNCTEEDKKTFMDSLNKLNNGADTAEKLSVLDTEQLMRYFVVHTFVCNNDSITGIFAQNFYLAEKDGKFSYVPWDYNNSFGGFEFQTAIEFSLGKLVLDMTPERLNNIMPLDKSLVNYPIDEPVIHGTVNDIPMLGTWLNDEASLAEYHKLYDEFIKKFENGDYETLQKNAHDLILPYVKQGLTFYNEEEFETASEQELLFLKYRSEAIRGQLDGKIPTTKEGQSKRADSLTNPDGLDVGLMRDDSSTVTGVPPAPYLNQLITAFLGNDPDNSIGHFSDLILGYWRNPESMYHRVPELLQVPALRNGAMNIIHQKYGTNGLFAVKGAENKPVQKQTETTAEASAENETADAESVNTEETNEGA